LLDAGVDYRASKDNLLVAYSMALELKKDIDYENSPNKQRIYNLMYQRILKDVAQASKDDNLGWFINAVDIAHELINSPIPEQHGMTPAMQLAKDNHLEAFLVIEQNLREDQEEDEETLSTQGLDVFNTVDDFGKTAFHYAFEQGHKELSLWLFDKTKIELTPIEKACKEGDEKELDRLLRDSTTDVSVNNNACLLWAIMQGHKNIITKLIDCRKSIMRRQKYLSGKSIEEKYIVVAGADEVDVSFNNNIALITAIRCAYADLSYLDIAKQLIDAGCDINAQDNLILNYVKEKFKQIDNIETETTDLAALKILDFVYQAQATLTTKRLLPIKEQLAATSIQYAWASYKIKREESNAEQELIKQFNKDKQEIENLPAHKIFVSAFDKIKKAKQGETVTIASIEEAIEIIKQGGMVDVANRLSLNDGPSGRILAQTAPQIFSQCISSRYNF